VTGAVTVCADGTAAGHAAVRWAAAEARRRSAPLDLVVADCAADDGPPFSRALSALRRAAPGLPGLGHPARHSAVDTLRRSSADATALVIPSTLPDLNQVVAESYCPVVIVPDGTAAASADGPVVLAAAPWTGDEVFAAAFSEAQDRSARLLVVRVWNDPRIDLGRLLPARIARWDATVVRARRELEAALSAWRVAHPRVVVDSTVVQDSLADFLLAMSYRAGLVVVGRSARGALLAGLAGSPVAALTGHAHCPVMVVPTAGPPRWALLPSRGRGLALAGSTGARF
jgi:nucleotide-binding universal stress UspA family protein